MALFSAHFASQFDYFYVQYLGILESTKFRKRMNKEISGRGGRERQRLGGTRMLQVGTKRVCCTDDVLEEIARSIGGTLRQKSR